MAENKNIKGTIKELNVYHTDAYAVAVRNGFNGTEAEWLESLKGLSAYDVAVKNGFKGTEAEWLESLSHTGSTIVAAPSRIGYVTILAEKWVGEESPYSQVVTVSGVTKNSQVDLTPNVDQLSIFHHKDLAFVTENDDGVVTVYAIGQKPENDYTIQVTITEVEV